MRLISAKEAVQFVRDGMTLGLTGFGLHGQPEELFKALEERFLSEGSPRNLTLYWSPGMGFNCGVSIEHFAHKDFVGKIYSGHIGLGKTLYPFILNNDYPVFLVPQGVIEHCVRAKAAREPGILTKVGLKTYADPRVEGCKANQAAVDSGEEVVQVMEIDGEEYLYYKTYPFDMCFIKATTADEDGNLACDHEANFLGLLEMATATKASGGVVIAQVERVVQKGTIPSKEVKVPQVCVDYVVVGSPQNSCQVLTHEGHNECWAGEIKIPLDDTEPYPFGVKKVIAKRAALELQAGSFVNLGLGVPQIVAEVVAEAGKTDKMILSAENGVIGGVPQAGNLIGTCVNATAIIKHPEMFDLYHGGLLDLTCLGLAEVDCKGNVNVSKFNGNFVGPGGFIDIAQNAKKICFCGTFMATGAEIEIKDGQVHILKEGRGIKFKKQVEQISFSGEMALANRQPVYFITERCVMKLTSEGLMIVEIAPGIDLQKDIIRNMEFVPMVDKTLKLMDPRLFEDKKLELDL